MKIVFNVRRWLDKDKFSELREIADYLGREENVGSKFQLNIKKIIDNKYSLERVVEILEDVGVHLGDVELRYLSNMLKEKNKVSIEWMGNDVILKPKVYLGDVLSELKGMISYSRTLKAFKIKPYKLFELKKKLQLLGLTIDDSTGLQESLKTPFKVEFKGELRDYQEDALKHWVERGMKGVIALPTGSGKTIIALAALAKLNERTLVVTYTKEQMFQWADMIESFTNIPSKYIGLYYGEEKQLSPIVISTYQTAYRHIKRIARFFTFLIIDECLTKDTIVVMEDGGVKDIVEVEDGDRVLGGVVSNKFSKISNNLYYIKSSFTDLIATATHPHIVARFKRGKHERQQSKIAIVVTPSYKIKPGDYLLVPEEIPHVTRRLWSPEQLRFVALITCNGRIERDKPIIKVTLRGNDEEKWVRKVFIDGVKAFNVHNHIIESTNYKRGYVIECCSPDLVRILTQTFNIPRGRKASIIDISNEIFYSPLESIKAFIEVCFSCKGWLERRRKNCKRLYLACTSRRFILKLQLLLKKFGIHSSFTVKNDSRGYDIYQLYISNLDFNKAMEIFTFLKRSLNTNERNVGRYVNSRLGCFRLARITKVKKLHESMEVYDFTSNGTNTFFANGIWTHNCHHLPADKFKHIAINSFATKRMGLSATVVREDGKHEELFPLMGGVVYFKTPSDLSMRGYLAPYQVIPVYVELSDDEFKEYKETLQLYKNLASGLKFQEILARAKRGDKTAVQALKVHSRLRQIVHKSKGKLEAVRSIVNKELLRGSKILIFTQYVDQAELLGEALGVPVLTGETENRLRRRILEDFKSGKSRVLVVTTVGDEGLDLPDVNVGIIVTGTGSRRQFVQRLGRLLRPGEGKESRLYEIIVKGTSEEYVSKRRKKISIDELIGLGLYEGSER